MLRFLLVLLLPITLGAAAPQQRRAPVVLAAASLQESLSAAADRWAAAGHRRPTLSFAASSALARQIAAGAPADLFLSADEPWMDALERRGLLSAGTRRPLLANRLVLIAPLASQLETSPRWRDLPALLGRGRLAMADPAGVPAGRYGKAALQRLGLWHAITPRIVAAENVRAALALVERGAAPFGIVYATDARASDRVQIVGIFPAASHPAIVYPIARLERSRSADAEAFRRFLLSDRGLAIFRRYGFTTPR
ncbi:molybdate ABC transporter substrate-binding protein [Sphingomonas japonica]|uniref:Molybdate transport system substrate-binding protein n=1 Tax=Sphingomonas japonica TaxID=511662 RepID=A0ABX0TX15_9SPHN|nr:molybdate ABC transporter substrate-binding protein [Sphingomonas japonica]NIJ22846.1 molybdate transport system substrate-binding protein [Sphingomonas japonica]